MASEKKEFWMALYLLSQSSASEKLKFPKTCIPYSIPFDFYIIFIIITTSTITLTTTVIIIIFSFKDIRQW